MFFCLCASDVSAGQENSNGDDTNIFGKQKTGALIYYSKSEPSGCVTELRVKQNSKSMDLVYGYCEAKREKLESVGDISRSFLDIVKHNMIEDEIKNKNMLTVNIAWKIAHWPLIDYINKDDRWPQNILQYLNDKYVDISERREVYKQILQDELLEKDVYLPILYLFKDYGCKVSLSKDFIDSFNIENQVVSRSKIVKWGVFEEGSVTKDFYPLIKGSVVFDVSCNQWGQEGNRVTH